MTAMVRVGRIPVGLALIAYGAVKITDGLNVTVSATGLLLKLWPLLLIALGAEYLIRSMLGEGRSAALRFDFGGVFLLLLAVAIGSGITAVQWAVERGAVAVVQAPVVRTLAVDAPATGVKSLRLSTSMGRIEVRPGSSDTIHVETTLSAHAGDRVRPTDVARQLEQAEVRVTPGANAAVSVNLPALSGAGLSISYSVSLPPGLLVEAESQAGSIQVFNYQGDLHLTSRMGPVNVDSGSGSLDVQGTSGSVLVRSFNGPISARTEMGRVEMVSTIGDLRLDTQSGPVVVTDFSGGGLEAHTNMGSVQARTDLPLAGDVKLSTQSGSITLSLPGSSSMRVTARTNAGSLNLPASLQRTRDGMGWSGSGTVGDGKYQVDLRTQMGPLTLFAR